MADRADNIRPLPNVGPNLMPSSYVASSVTTQRVRWLSPGRIAQGKITILDGDPGLGKSQIAIDFAARVTTGRALPGVGGWEKNEKHAIPRGVVMLSAEDDDADTIVPRLIAAEADLRRVSFLKMRDEQGNEYLPVIGRNILEIEHLIESTNAALLIIDPLMAYLDADVKSNSDQDVRRVLSPLASMASRTGCAVLVLRHLNKAAGMASLYRGGGSIGIIGAARVGLLAAKDPDDESGQRRVLAVQKCNIGPEVSSIAFRVVGLADDMSRIEWLGHHDKSATQLLGQVIDPTDRAEATETELWLAGLLAEGEIDSVEVYKQARRVGFSERTIRRAQVKIGAKAVKRGFGKDGQWMWSLPDGPKRPPTGATLITHAHRASDDPFDDDEEP